MTVIVTENQWIRDVLLYNKFLQNVAASDNKRLLYHSFYWSRNSRWFWAKVSHDAAIERQPGPQSSKPLLGRALGLSTGLIECPHNVAAGFRQERAIQESEAEATMCLATSPQTTPSITSTIFSWLRRSALLSVGGGDVST